MKDLFEKCNEDMKAHDIRGLKELLKEAKEQKVVLEKVMEDGDTLLSMPYPELVLQKVLDNTLE
jgi:hypothetical protein